MSIPRAPRRIGWNVLAALTLGLGGVMATPLSAVACGGLFCQNIPVDQAGEKILFATDGQTVTAHVQIQYQGDAKNFSWIVPVPTPPTLGVGSDLLFTALRAATKPTFNLALQTEGTCRQEDMMREGAMMAPTSASAADSGVTVVSQQEVGPYASAVIQANDTGPLITWLTENGYIVPPKMEMLLAPYIEGKYFFVALKLKKDQSAGDLQPIVLNYRSTKPGIPIRLTGIAATENMGVFVWVLGKQRAVPENYRHATINEARIDWLSGGQNYPAVVTAAMNEAGGQAFVTDFAGAASAVDQAPFDAKNFDLTKLRTLTDPAAFADAVVNDGYFGGRNTSLNSARLVSFLKRYIPKPASLASVDETQFYRFLGNYKSQLAAAQITVDTAKAVADLTEEVLKPLGEIKEMLGKHAYLTALYTTMSPYEMTQDPMFIFNPDLPKVSNVHEAKGLVRCNPNISYYEAPVEITLTNGITFLSTRPTGYYYGGGEVAFGPPGGPDPIPTASGAKAIAMPASLRIEQLTSSGGASLIQDNRDVIIKALKEAGVAVGTPTTGGPGPSPITAVAVGPQGDPVAVPTPFHTSRPANTTTTKTLPGESASSNSATAAGFGCAGCASTNGAPPPKTQGAGEGLTYAALMVGFLGWRRWRKKS